MEHKILILRGSNDVTYSNDHNSEFDTRFRIPHLCRLNFAIKVISQFCTAHLILHVKIT